MFERVGDVPTVFEELVNIAEFQEIDYLIVYFADNYIGLELFCSEYFLS